MLRRCASWSRRVKTAEPARDRRKDPLRAASITTGRHQDARFGAALGRRWRSHCTGTGYTRAAISTGTGAAPATASDTAFSVVVPMFTASKYFVMVHV